MHTPSYMWQSRVEIEGYSVAYFDRSAVLEGHCPLLPPAFSFLLPEGYSVAYFDRSAVLEGQGLYVLRRCMNI